VSLSTQDIFSKTTVFIRAYYGINIHLNKCFSTFHVRGPPTEKFNTRDPCPQVIILLTSPREGLCMCTPHWQRNRGILRGHCPPLTKLRSKL